MVNRHPPEQRPEAIVEGLGPRFGEYPVPLLTRRTWSLRANEVINRRESSPGPVWTDPRSYPDVRETCSREPLFAEVCGGTG